MRILFEYTGRAYLPEIAAYRRYLAASPGIETADTREYPAVRRADFDVVWRLMGLDFAKTDRFVVHDYASLSTGFMPRARNRLKKHLNRKPGLRVFLNEAVRSGFAFADAVPWAIRDMGVDESFFRVRAQPEYDLVYVGNVIPGRGVPAALAAFLGPLKSLSVLVVGHADKDVRQKFAKAGNVVFAGSVPHDQVAALAAKAKAGLNLVPNRYPLGLQTSTKLLEYCALGLDVASTRHGWSETFARTRQARFLWCRPDLSDLTPQAFRRFDFHSPDVRDWEWTRIIATSGVFRLLAQAVGRPIVEPAAASQSSSADRPR